MDTLATIVISSQSYNILNWEFWKKNGKWGTDMAAKDGKPRFARIVKFTPNWFVLNASEMLYYGLTTNFV